MRVYKPYMYYIIYTMLNNSNEDILLFSWHMGILQFVMHKL